MANFTRAPGFGDQIPTRSFEEECTDEECFNDCTGEEARFDDIIFMSVRCAAAVVTVILIVLVFVSVGRGVRVKSWRLYLLTALTFFAWLAMSLYQDHFDKFYVHYLECNPQSRSNYECVRYLVHGLALFLVVLVLGHMSDFQHHGSWLALIFAVVLVPLFYSIGHIVVDLRLEEKIRVENGKAVNTGITAVRVALYNVVTTVLLIVFSRRICTRTLYGTYEDHRRPLVVLSARWTFVFLVLHNLAEIGSFVATTLARYTTDFDTAETSSTVHRSLEEAKYFLFLLAVPFSYVVAAICNCCCGVDRLPEVNFEMDGVDKVYSQGSVTYPKVGSPTTQIQNTPLPEPGQGRLTPLSTNPNGVSMTPNRSMGAASAATTATGGGGTSSVSNQGSVSTLTSIGEADSVGQLPSMPRPGSQASSASRTKNRQSYLDAVSYGSTGPPPPPNSNSAVNPQPSAPPLTASNGRPQSRNKRESYMQAMSETGSINSVNNAGVAPNSAASFNPSGGGAPRSHNTSFDHGSISSEPIDL